MSFFKRLASGPSAERAYNRALDIYQTLRQYPVQSREYHFALIEICSQCQQAIAGNDRHGDAHVMLSNTYLLLHVDLFPLTSNSLPIKLAAAVIQHWSEEPMRQRPWTKNVDNGWSVHNMVSSSVAEAESMARHDIEYEMTNLKRELYSEALSSQALSVIREIALELRQGEI